MERTGSAYYEGVSRRLESAPGSTPGSKLVPHVNPQKHSLRIEDASCRQHDWKEAPALRSRVRGNTYEGSTGT